VIIQGEKIDASGCRHAERDPVFRDEPARAVGKTEYTILVVNDTSDQAEMMSLLLRKSGYHVITASDGREGFEAAQAEYVTVTVSWRLCRNGHPALNTQLRQDEEMPGQTDEKYNFLFG
jgi:PleD family two-component response regulator